MFLDTNIVIDLLRARRPQVRERFAEARRDGVGMSLSSIVLFVLRFGPLNGAHVDANLQALDAWLAEGFEIVDFGKSDATEAGEIRAHLRRERKEMGPYDILIAAQARRRGATLVTLNTKEMSRVPGLQVVDWA
jgi:tRNA(fMet)-specific endonuclease VapC